MKQFILAAFMLTALTTTKATAQAVTPTQNGLPQTMWQPHIYNGYSNWIAPMYCNSPTIWGAEFTTSRNYTVLGTFPIVVDSAQFQDDSITLSKTNLQPGQSFRILLTATNNDTLKIFHDNSFNGATASPFLLTPATAAALKHTQIYVDKYGNYWQY